MVDCGFSLRETTARLQRFGLQPQQLDAILVTHEHGDHCSGVGTLSRRHGIPVYLTYGTASSGRVGDCAEQRLLDCHSSFDLGDLRVQPVAVPHDAREPCQFVFDHDGARLGILTDLGSITPWVLSCYAQCNALLLEFNHDRQMLQEGRYPENLKRRVGGDWGHLSNAQAAALLQQLGLEQLQHLVIAHISEANNCRERVLDSLQQLSFELAATELVWAEQVEGFDWLPVVASAADSGCSAVAG